ncbi:hypothetical protein ACHQM5_012373 [Ranunculus cassubicifolius]
MEGFPRSQWRDAAPTHFIFRIESFSTLASSTLERHETCEFEAGDYKWKLALYPNGNKSKGGEDYLSMYLVFVGENGDELKKEIQVSFTFLVFDYVREKYLSIQEVSRFDAKKSESGFDKLLPLKIFNDPSNGYLVNDTCTFGADVYLMENPPKKQCLSMMMLKPPPFKYAWKIEKFSQLEKESYCSDKFTTRGHDWKVHLYPKGIGEGEGNLSVFLYLEDTETNGRQVIAEYTFRIVDQITKIHKVARNTKCFIGLNANWGRHILPLSDLNESTGYLVKDTCILEIEVAVLGSAKEWN